ncbi:hypothetical protein [Microvirga lenta]|uniref:hypothetical protein n=1 Tax=Microvirga lenta TaxID=2881337 RepID=UPI001CFF7A65|nr:hypothetical protein [Microvirga lenta]MCB5177532.1 hypothetical protein [Microvirga lenta]
MLHSIRAVYARQWALVKGDPEAEAAYRHGLGRLTDIFLDCLVENIEDRLRAGNRLGALQSARLLKMESLERWNALLDRSLEVAVLEEELAAIAVAKHPL